ncbi:MAG TPA: CPBP family intramembrane metalloprotease [Terrimesophilobacter sp.]|nr:CPBP family intramembrane metalloprotease [Terrimesophilobacter sp.]HRQ00393.1 CPBP family intramembrane metalloprotease [Terrimesophilobacter sp.]
MSDCTHPEPVPSSGHRRIGAEIGIVLALSFGASAVYSIVNIANRLTMDVALSEQTATLHRPLSTREVFDFIYQFLAIFFDFAAVALVIFLLWRSAAPRLGALGIDLRMPLRDLTWGVGLTLAIGIPGILLYLVGRELGVTVNVVPTALDTYWWTVPILVLSALRAGVTEEVIVVGYLFERLRRLGWGTWTIILSTATLRGTYHLYQGFGAFAGNIAMGVLFGWLYHRYGRLLPLIIAHTLIDVAVFVGYPWATGAFDWL